MPRKKRDIKRDYRQAGFTEDRGKGDHAVYRHPLIPRNYAVAGNDGDDAAAYDERNLREALRTLADAQGRQ